MQQILIKTSSVKFLIGLFALGLFIAVNALNASAQTTTFAQFFEDDGSQDYSFTNSTTSATFNTVTGGSNIFFIYQNIAGLNSALQGPQAAVLRVTTTTTTPAIASNGGLDQPLNQTVTITITRSTPAPSGVGSGTRTNLLTAVINTGTASPLLTGGSGGGSASFSATTPNQTVVFSSDFVVFTTTNQRNVSLSFSSVQPSFTSGAGGFLASFTAAATGTFASNPVPIVPPPNTAAVVSISGRVIAPASLGLTNALVTLTDANGGTQTTLTGKSGNFRFSDVSTNGTYIITVSSKRYTYAPQIISPTANLTGIEFIAQ